jgi:hypothetical protein
MAYYLPWGTRLASSGADAYEWYSALDLSEIPFHTGSGDWGSQRAVTAPDAPSTTTSVNVTTESEFVAAYEANARQITVIADLSNCDCRGGVLVNDVDIIINSGVTVRNMYLGNASGTSGTRRVRVRGPTVGSHSGGQVHQLWFTDWWTDIIVDGIDWSGYGLVGGDATVAGYVGFSEVGKVALVNNRIATGSAFMIGVTPQMFVAAGNSILTGLKTPRPTAGQDEAWHFRINVGTNGTVVLAHNDLRGSRYDQIRIHPTGSTSGNGGYVYIGRNLSVDNGEGKMLWVDAAAASQTGKVNGVWYHNNRVYASGGTHFESNDSMYFSRLDNTFRGSYTSGAISISGATNGNVSSGDQFLTATSDPAWEGAGDASLVDEHPEWDT